MSSSAGHAPFSETTDYEAGQSRAEIEAFTAIPGMRSVCVPQGKLSLREEFPDQLAQLIAPFLACGV
jgi:hypothetical protein